MIRGELVCSSTNGRLAIIRREITSLAERAGHSRNDNDHGNGNGNFNNINKRHSLVLNTADDVVET